MNRVDGQKWVSVGREWGRIFGLMIALLAAMTATVAKGASTPVALSGRAMGTTWSVKFVPSAPAPAADVVERAVTERLEQLEQIFSTYRADSELSRFNASGRTEWISVSPELARVATESRRISELMRGAFDVTVLPLVQLWGFGTTRRSGSLPAASEIARTREGVDWRKLKVRASPPALCKVAPRIAADFSSMAKGFAADSVSELLVRLNAPNHLVQIGGDVKAGGGGPDGAGWRVAIERPSTDSPAVAEVVALNGTALSTSGDYRNFFVSGGRRYGHIIDPRTGEPVSGTLAAVSVVHASCATSSALATALFVLGADEGYRLATAEHLAGFFQERVGAEIRVRATPELERVRP